jgi:hypothetical protein
VPTRLVLPGWLTSQVASYVLLQVQTIVLLRVLTYLLTIVLCPVRMHVHLCYDL